MGKIKIYLAGGFGNNLFQICYGTYLEEQGYSVSYNSYLTQRNILTKILGWSIHNYNTTKEILSSDSVEDKLNILDLVYLLKRISAKKLLNSNFLVIPKRNPKRYFGYCNIGPHLNSHTISKVKERIENTFSPKTTPVKECAVHLRLGDFDDNHRLTMDYYVNAIMSLDKSIPVRIVTDDKTVLDKILSLIKDRDISLVESQSVLEDFLAIYESEYVIMSNSTFCYWAAVLGLSSRVIHPSRISTNEKWGYFLNKDGISLDTKFESELA